MEDKEEVTINLHKLYADYKVAKFGEKVNKGEIAFASNHRMVYVYPIKQGIKLQDLVENALVDSKIAMAAWAEMVCSRRLLFT